MHTTNISGQAKAPGLGWKESFIDGSPEAEADFINQAIADIHAVQASNKKKAGAGSYERAFHAKIQAGIKNAQFRISENLPQQLRIGFFQPGKQYTSSVRFSNASGVIQPDTAKDLRGIAVRLVTESGEQHDFLATNGSASHARDARQFIQFAKAGAGAKLLTLPRLLLSVGLFETVRMLKTVIRQASRPVESLTSEIYYSRAPYKFDDCALKFQLVPSVSPEASVTKSAGYLREDLVERLKKGPVVFDFRIQLFANEAATPIEDGSVEWDSPLITVAQLVIPQQDLNSAEGKTAQAEVENLEFNPWNTTEDFRPLGSLNRARRLVYQASVALRKGLRS